MPYKTLERRATEKPWRHSEERLRLAAEAAQFGIYDADLVAGTLYWSPQMLAILGLPPDAPLPAPDDVPAFVHPDDVEQVRRMFRQAFDPASDGRAVGEHRVLQPSGAVRWVQLRGQIYFAGKGAQRRAIRSTGIVVDVTAAKEAAQRLAAELDAMTRLQKLGTLFVREGKLEPVLGEIVETAIAIAGADFGHVQFLDPATGNLRIVAQRGLPPWWVDFWGAADRGLSAGSAGLACGERVVIEDVEESLIFAAPPALEIQRRAGVRALQCTPLFSRSGTPLGTITTHYKTRHRPDERTQRLLDLLARQTADIIERAHSEEALRASEERLHLAYQAGGIGAFEWNVRTGENTWTPRLEALYGLAPGEFGKTPPSWEQLVHPDDRAAAVADVERALASGEPQDGEWRVVWPDGSVHWIAARFQAFGTAEGGPLRLIGVNLDITERKAAEKNLRESELFYRQTLDSIPGMVFTTRPDGRCDFQSQQWADYTGVPVEEHLGEGWKQLLHPDDRPRAEAAWRTALGGRGLYDLEYRVRRHDGVHEWFRVIGRPIRDAEGRIARWFGVALNIHKLKKAEAALRETNRRKDEFLATLAHELRNPLAPIANAAAILQLTGPTDPTSQAASRMIERQVRHMTRLIDDLLDVSRISRGKLQLRMERIELGTILQQTIEAARPAIAGAGHELSVALLPRPIYLDGDPVRLAQVFANLLNNACTYTPKGGRIRLAVEHAGSEAIVKVQDSGLGIPPEHLLHIFEMFHQVSSDSSQPRAGLGIGLSLVRAMVEMHGGRVEAWSDGAGKGSTFIARLPAGEGCPPPGAAPAQQAEGSGIAAGRILIADDNANITDSLAQFLRLKGIEVHTARDGLEAVSAAECFHPDLVLLDLGMPDLDGYGACRQMRRQPWGKVLTIVAITGWGQDSDRRKTRDAGFDDHLVKPVAPAEILDLLAKARAARR